MNESIIVYNAHDIIWKHTKEEEMNLAPFDASVNIEVVLFNSTNISGSGSLLIKSGNFERSRRLLLKRCCFRKESLKI